MGSFLGRIGEETPQYKVVRTTPAYEVRSYAQCAVATAARLPSGTGRHTGFRALARYIGVFGSPENTRHEVISMTAPVGLSSDESQMWFYLPMSKFECASAAPPPSRPTDVEIATLPYRTEAVLTFSGAFSHSRCVEKARQL
eukprot:Selendium_serpulae@DN4526_c3_g2_i1.p3